MVTSAAGASGSGVLPALEERAGGETYASGAGYIGSHYVPPPPGFIPPDTVYGGGVSVLVQQKMARAGRT